MRPFLILLCLLGSSAQAVNLTVFAASSLTDAFTEMGRAFDACTGHHTRFNFAGSQVLRLQLEQGARADVFASANAAQYSPLVATGKVSPGVAFARNRLVLIVSERSGVGGLGELARPGTRLVVALPTVPAGEATHRVLGALQASEKYGPEFARRVLKNVVSQEANVRQVALKVSLGQADAAFVYQSDATSLGKQVKVIQIPAQFNVVLGYPIGAVRGGQAQAAQQFIAFVKSAQGQQILRKRGFLGAS